MSLWRGKPASSRTRVAKVEPGSSVVVFGLGGIGLNVVQGARIAGADLSSEWKPNGRRRALSETLGVSEFLDPNALGSDLIPYILDATRGGADFPFECVAIRR